MDLATIIGMIVAGGGIIIGFLMEGGKMESLISPSAAVIVFGGSIGATVLSFTLKHSISVPRILKNAFFSKQLDQLETLNLLVDLARKARKNGILGLESEAASIDSPFLQRAIQMVVDGVQPELVREILETELDAMSTRHKAGEDFFMALGGFAPTLGVLGTVMGLVHMLENLSEPGTMGPSIATAFIATFYGVGSANIVFLPFAAKLKLRSKLEVAVYEMAIEGVLSLQAGDNPRVVAMKMRSYLSPEARKELEKVA